jgi:hypothetical protein
MEQVKYKVVRFDIETKYGTKREVENTLACQIVEREIVGEFNTIEEAKKCYDGLKNKTIELSDCYINECKEIEVYYYDDDEEEFYLSHDYEWDFGGKGNRN